MPFIFSLTWCLEKSWICLAYVKIIFESLWNLSSPPFLLMARPDVDAVLKIEGGWIGDLGSPLLMLDIDGVGSR